MKWFYKLKSTYRIIIAVAAWLPLVILAGIMGGTADELSTPVTIVGVVLLALGIVVTVFAVKAASKDKKEKQATINEKSAILVKDSDIDSCLAVIESELSRINIDAMPQTNSAEIKIKKALAQKQLDLINEKKELINRKLAIMEEQDITIKERAAKKTTDSVTVSVHNFMSMPINTKVVGVTFENRQEYLAMCNDGDSITIEHAPTVEYPDSITVTHDITGNMLGHIKSELAKELLINYGRACHFSGEINEITGGDEGKNYGCNITFDED